MIKPSILITILLTTLSSAPVFAENKSGPSNAIKQLCSDWSAKLRTTQYKPCLAMSLEESGHQSVEGRSLVHREFLPPSSTRPEYRVLAIGGVHGDEFSAISISYLWMQAMLDNPQTVDHHWLFLPLANPDGLLRPRSTRENANGVDLNRNFPTPDWDEAAHKYWIQHTRSNPRRFPGTAAASEPETQWQVSIIQAFQPDAIISIHAPYGLLDYDGPDFARPDQMGHLKLRQLGTFPGSLGRYAGEYLNIPVLTIELEAAGRLPSEADILQMWQDMNEWIEGKLIVDETDF